MELYRRKLLELQRKKLNSANTVLEEKNSPVKAPQTHV